MRPENLVTILRGQLPWVASGLRGEGGSWMHGGGPQRSEGPPSGGMGKLQLTTPNTKPPPSPPGPAPCHESASSLKFSPLISLLRDHPLRLPLSRAGLSINQKVHGNVSYLTLY